ncbi:tyrosine phosphatase family protein [Arvimicrobium flavum]|uniref:tyrosine phosphatase family protein n=1 Tax=Arvimicrobium flavum TaxID=3393320 RepID=UPI00237BF786|nr:protein tyrosine phosphatase [Mesorhizobium shangrilense]
MIYVTPLSKLEDTLMRSGARRLVTLLREDADFVRPVVLAPGDHLLLQMHDITEEADGMVAPAAAHVAELLAFVRAWDRSAPLAINCYAGISRSTAAAYIVAAALAPGRDEGELARRLREASPSATPNARLIALADDMLGRRGRMVDGIRAIGRGCDAFEGTPFVLGFD